MSDNQPNQCVKHVPLFKNLNSSELDEIVNIAHHKKMMRGEFIYHLGDSIESLYVIHRGKVKISRMNQDGKEQVIRILKNGDFLGELALFNTLNTPHYAEVIEPSIICMVEQKELKKLMAKSPELSIKMLEEVTNRLDHAEKLIEHNNLYDALTKVVKLLLDLEKNLLVKFPTSKTNLASNLGMTPETFSRKLAVLTKKGYIHSIENKLIMIDQKEALKKLLE